MKKLKITLACAGGMSSSMLCKKIIAASEKKGYTGTECEAYSVHGLQSAAPGSDVILLGPQVGYMKDTIVKKYPDIPVEVIYMKDYGMMNGEKIFNDIAEKFGW